MLRKRLITVILFVMVFQMTGLSQRFPYSSFLNVGHHECTVEVMIVDSELGFEVLVENFSVDEINRGKCGYILDAQTYSPFIQELRVLESKYDEWISIAKKNEVMKFHKNMNSNFPTMYTIFNTDQFCADNEVVPTVKFDIITMFGETNYCLTISSGQMVDMTQPYQVHGGMILNFLDLDSFSKFINMLEYENIMTAVKIHKSEGDLFK